ncbi:MAG: response regulator [Desulfobacteraceae bacterium]|nr:response regulator [Desulfobacteraceae bacterium]
MSIRTKLFSAFSAIVVLMAIIGIWNILVLNNSHTQFNQISGNTAPAIIALNNIKIALLEMKSDATEIAMQPLKGHTDEQIRKKTKNFKASEKKLREWTKKLAGTSTPQNSYDEIISAINTCSQVARNMADLKSERDSGTDRKQEFEKIRDELVRLLDRKTDLEMNRFSKLSLSATHYTEHYVLIFLSLLIIGIIAALVLGFTISNNISVSINILKEAAQGIGKGKPASPIQIRSNDEIGQLAESLYSMKEELMIFREDIERRTFVLTQSNVSLLEEIEKRKRTERYLKRARIEAETASQAKSEFLTNLSHEIRTPLNGIIGYTELGMDARPDANLMNIFNMINSGANALLDVVNDILDFSKIEAGRLELENIPFDLMCTIEDLADIIAFRAEHKGLKSASFISPEVPSHLIGDPGRLRQVITNITGNALKFTSEGEIFIRAEMAEDLGSKVKIRFSVKDTGIGIPKRKQALIFKTFSFADEAAPWDYGRTGLGLAISKELAELMGGKIGVESREGKGSEFWFTAIFTKTHKDQKERLVQKSDLKDLKVLVIDNNPTSRFVLTEYLKSWGCLPVEASGGKEALSVLNEHMSAGKSFNLILTDYIMPEINGFDLAKEIRSIETFKQVPILVITSAGRTGDGKKSRELGIDGYLTKPIKRDILYKAIQLVLDGSVKQGEPKLVTRHTIAEDFGKE